MHTEHPPLSKHFLKNAAFYHINVQKLFHITELFFLIIIYIYTLKVVVSGIAVVQPTGQLCIDS